jgi:hypothetical protein
MPSSSSLPTVAATLMLSLCASFTVSATATPVTPYNDALLAWHSPDVAAPAFFGSQRARELQAAGGALPAASTQHTDSGAWGSVSGLASADLSSGQLKTRAAVDFVSPPDAALYMQSNTRFGDGFRTTTTGGSPFAWVPGQGARFSLHLDGTMTSTQPLESLGGGAFLILTLFQPGTLTADQNGISGPNILKSYAYFLGNPNQNLLSCFQGSCVSIIPEATFTDFADGLDIVQDINPGGDFDWQVLLGSAAWLYEPGSYDFDFSHTVTVGYQGPAGALTQSVSGVFDNIGDPVALVVPEPGSLLMVLMGLGGLVGLGRHRQQAIAHPHRISVPSAPSAGSP